VLHDNYVVMIDARNVTMWIGGFNPPERSCPLAPAVGPSVPGVKMQSPISTAGGADIVLHNGDGIVNCLGQLLLFDMTG
jgi:hypothetical protein